MGDEHVGQPEPLLQVLEQVDDPGLHRDVERGDRLVEHQHPRLERERAGDADALALAAGELVRVPVAVLGVEPDELEQLGDARLALLVVLPQPVHLQRLADDVVDRHLRVQRGVGVLEDDLQLAPHRPHLRDRQPGELAPLEPHRAGGRLVQLEDGPAGGRLAAAGLPHHAEGLPGVDVEAHAGHRLDVTDDAAQQPAALDREVHHQVTDLQQAVRAGLAGGTGRGGGPGLLVHRRHRTTSLWVRKNAVGSSVSAICCQWWHAA